MNSNVVERIASDLKCLEILKSVLSWYSLYGTAVFVSFFVVQILLQNHETSVLCPTGPTSPPMHPWPTHDVWQVRFPPCTHLQIIRSITNVYRSPNCRIVSWVVLVTVMRSSYDQSMWGGSTNQRFKRDVVGFDMVYCMRDCFRDRRGQWRIRCI